MSRTAPETPPSERRSRAASSRSDLVVDLRERGLEQPKRQRRGAQWRLPPSGGSPVPDSLLELYTGSSPFDGLRWRPDWSGLKVIIYARISDDDDETFEGVARQKRLLIEMVEARGADLVEVLVDNSRSAWSGTPRPQFDAMIEMVVAGEADIILAYDIDRLYRGRTEFAWLCDFVEANMRSVAIVSIAGDFDLSSPDGRFKAGIMVEVGVLESEKTSRRQRFSNADLAYRGQLRKGGRRTFGWKADGVTPNPPEVRILKKAWRDLLDGASLRQIGLEWEAEGVQPALHVDEDGEPRRDKDGNLRPPIPWRERLVTIRNMLTNPHHVGDVVYRGSVVAADAFGGIIDRPTFEAVVAAVEGRTFKARGIVRRPNTTRLRYSGLLVCGRCEGERSMHRAKSGGRAVWRCPRCNLSIMAAPVEAMLDGYLLDLADDPTFRAAIRRGEVDDDDGAWAEVERLDDKMAEADDMFLKSEMSRASYTRNMRELKAQRQAATARLGRRERAKGLVRAMVKAGRVGDNIDKLPEELLGEFLAAIVEKATVKPATTRGRTFDPTRVDVDNTDAANEAIAAREATA